MRLKKSIMIAAGTAVVLLGPAYAAAAPLSMAAPASASAVTVAAARHATQNARRARAYHDPDYREYNDPDAYSIGSNHWWEEMDRQGRGGRG